MASSTLVKVGGKTIGEYDEATHTFVKRVSGKKHLFKKLDAWGIDAKVLEYLIEKDSKVVVFDKDDKVVYKTTAKKIKEDGSYYHFKGEVDHRAQVFLPRALWQNTQKSS